MIGASPRSSLAAPRRALGDRDPGRRRIHAGPSSRPGRSSDAPPAYEPGPKRHIAGVAGQAHGDDHLAGIGRMPGQHRVALELESRSRRRRGSRRAWPPPAEPGPVPGPMRRRTRRDSPPDLRPIGDGAQRTLRDCSARAPACSTTITTSAPYRPSASASRRDTRARRSAARAPRRQPDIRRLSRGSDGLERHLPKLSVACFGECQDRSAITAPWLRSEAAAPARGPHRHLRRRCGPAGVGRQRHRLDHQADFPSCAGFTSSGFFLAAMMPLSEAKRGAAIPSSIVSTAGSGNSHRLRRTFELPPSRAPAVGDLELGDRGDAGGPAARPSSGPPRRWRCRWPSAEEDQVVTAVLELGREGLGDGQAVEGTSSALSCTARAAPMASPFRRVSCTRVGSERKHHDLTRALLFL